MQKVEGSSPFSRLEEKPRSAALTLVDNLTREELLTKGWSVAGTTTLPRFQCEGGFLGSLLGALLTALLSGPENPYSMSIRAPTA